MKKQNYYEHTIGTAILMATCASCGMQAGRDHVENYQQYNYRLELQNAKKCVATHSELGMLSDTEKAIQHYLGCGSEHNFQAELPASSFSNRLAIGIFKYKATSIAASNYARVQLLSCIFESSEKIRSAYKTDDYLGNPQLCYLFSECVLEVGVVSGDILGIYIDNYVNITGFTESSDAIRSTVLSKIQASGHADTNNMMAYVASSECSDEKLITYLSILRDMMNSREQYLLYIQAIDHDPVPIAIYMGILNKVREIYDWTDCE